MKRSTLSQYFLICYWMLMAVSGNGQKRPYYFGKQNQLTIDKDIYWGLLFGKDAAIKGKSNILPRISLFKNIGKYTMMGFSVAYGKHTIDHEGDFWRTYTPVSDKQAEIYVIAGRGKLDLRTTGYLLHFKKYNRIKSIIPAGVYTSIDMGLSKSRLDVGEGYLFTGYDGDEYRTIETFRLKFSQILLSLGLGKSMPLYKDILLYDISFNVGTRIMVTNYRDNVKDQFVINASRFLLARQVFNLKAGVNYVF
jgi:hypothetical protein